MRPRVSRPTCFVYCSCEFGNRCGPPLGRVWPGLSHPCSWFYKSWVISPVNSSCEANMTYLFCFVLWRWRFIGWFIIFPVWWRLQVCWLWTSPGPDPVPDSGQMWTGSVSESRWSRVWGCRRRSVGYGSPAVPFYCHTLWQITHS